MKRPFIFLLAILLLNLACQTRVKGINSTPVQTIRIELASSAGAIAQKASDILAREITERSGAKVVEDKADLTIQLKVQPGIGTEGFKIEGRKNSIIITGNDENGLLYGVGKFLHTSRYDQGGFTAGTWRGTSVPKGTMRGIYFATHFNNWYESASDAERQRYIESLALWGINSLVVHYPNQWLDGPDDPKSKAWIRKMKVLMTDAREVGMHVGLLQVANAGFSTAPKEFRAKHGNLCEGAVILCPSNPHAKTSLLKDWGQLLDQFTDIGLDEVVYWPYDEGGCNCPKCARWGANGYPKLCRDLTSVLKAKSPGTKVVLSTWCFDYRPGIWASSDTDYMEEWSGLAKSLSKDAAWVDYIMADAHTDFPGYPLKKGVPNALPLLNFPEISMWGQVPWGGYGTNPLPTRFQRLWNQVKGKIAGGFPYSEGNYDDINKIICSQFYWDPGYSAEQAVREYISYEFSPSVTDDIWRVVQIFEENHIRQKIGQSAEDAFTLVKKADAELTPYVRKSWRWRLVYLRAQIDRELFLNHGKLKGKVLEDSFDELIRICHAENTGLPSRKLDGSDVPKAPY